MVKTFKLLKLFGMAQAVGALAEQNAPAWHSAESVLDALLKAEVADARGALDQLPDEGGAFPCPSRPGRLRLQRKYNQ